jgi:iron complex transport system substrate-binding protein
VRIVSLLPSTTEILFAIGAGDDVVGVTFECDYPAEARTRRIVSTSALPEGLTPGEIDAFVVRAMQRGDDLYHLDEGALSGLDADLVVTQDLCAVCAVDVSVVDDALAHLGCAADVLTIDPHTLDEVLESIVTLGRATGRLTTAESLVAEQQRRLDDVRRMTAGRPRPRVMFLEWTDPPFAPGHWIPEMIEIAGGEPLLATSGEKSRRVTWEQILAADPEIVIVAPCGFDAARAARETAGRGDRPTVCVDANAYYSRPAPRIAAGVAQLAHLLHPEAAPDPGMPAIRLA